VYAWLIVIDQYTLLPLMRFIVWLIQPVLYIFIEYTLVLFFLILVMLELLVSVHYGCTTLLLLQCSHLFSVTADKSVRIDENLAVLLTMVLMIVAVHRFKI
jgi:hypothetical protein